MSIRYQVIISGKTLDGMPLSTVRAAVGQAFGLRDDQLDRMLCGKPVPVSRNLGAEAAEKLLARLRAVGLEARREPVGEVAVAAPVAAQPPAESPRPPASQELFALAGANPGGPPATLGEATPESAPDGVTCPKCGEAQPKRTLCRACGLDMPRYRAIQEAEEREAREVRAAELAARRAGGGRVAATGEGRAALLSLRFSGRFGRLDYLAGSLLSTALWFGLVWLAVATGKTAFAGFGLLLSTVYGLRCIALRLHDTGRTGWLSLVAIVPVIGGLMALALLFLGGDEESNEYGPASANAGGGRAILALVASIVVATGSYRSITGSPENLMRFAGAMGFGAGQSAYADDADDGFPGAAVRYASNNRIDIYVIDGCTDCELMLAWLRHNELRPSIYSVDRDQQAAERLNSILGGSGRIQLPVLEVNGKVLSANPDVGEVHARLRQAVE